MPRSSPHQEIIWRESEKEEGAVAVSSSVFLARESFHQHFLAPTSLTETNAAAAAKDLTGEERRSYLCGIRRGPYPLAPNSSRLYSVSVQLELWVASRFLCCRFDAKVKPFSFPLKPPLGSFLLLC